MSFHSRTIQSVIAALIALLQGCGGGGGSTSNNDQVSNESTLLIPLSAIAGTWERKCGGAPIFMLEAPATPKATRADHYLTFTPSATGLLTTDKWVIYDYTDTTCTGPAVLTLQTSSANLNNQTGSTARGGTLTINRGPVVWEPIGSAIATHPFGSTTARLDHFKITFPGLFPETLDWPGPAPVFLYKQSGDFLFPPKYAGEGFTVLTVATESIRDISGALTGENAEMLHFGQSTKPNTLDTAITFFFNTYCSGCGYKRSTQ